MADKTLKSIKFPNLPDTYTIIQNAPEYDPEYYYWINDLCTYQGQLYIRNPSDSYDPGPFDPNVWFPISFHPEGFKWSIGTVAPYGYVEPYDPEESYYPGEIVYNDASLFLCIIATPEPAGSFQYAYWRELNYDISPVEHSYNSIIGNQTFTQYQSFNDLWKENLEFQLVQDGTTELYYADVFVQIDSNDLYDYLVAVPTYVDLSIAVERCYIDNDEVESSVVSMPCLYDGDEDEYYLYKIPHNYPFEDFSTLIGIRIIAKSKLNENLTLEDLDDLSLSIKIYRCPLNDTSLDNSAISRLLVQDYTQVIKSLKDSIFSQSNEKATSVVSDYIDSVKTPLSEGNIALQFIPAFNSLTWDDITIDLRLGKDNIGTVDHWILSKTDKTLYIISKDSSSKGQLTDADYFKLRVSYSNGDAVDYSLEDFVNSHLNILLKPKTQSSPNPIRKNSTANINEFLNIARSYMKAEGCYTVEQPTFLQTDQEIQYRNTNYDDFKLDSQTFVNLCLRGLNFDNTPYSANWTFPNYPQVESSQEEDQ